jgi:predicted Zn-dependent protease
MNLIIQTERKEDYSRIKEVTDLDFMQKKEGRLVESLRRNPDQQNWRQNWKVSVKQFLQTFLWIHLEIISSLIPLFRKEARLPSVGQGVREILSIK